MSDKKKNYPSTKQFRHVIEYMEEHGLDNILFQGTVKLHGTNLAVQLNSDGIEIYSRGNTLTRDDDSALYGAVGFIREREEVLKSVLGEGVNLHGEFIGKGIQSNVAVSQLDKSFVIFDCSKGSIDEKEFVGLEVLKNRVSMLELEELNKHNIYFITQTETFPLRIFLDNLSATKEYIEATTLAVENECPFAKILGVTGIGEGVVWKAVDDKNNTNLWFKTKGEKHKKQGKTKAILPDSVVDEYNNFIDEHLLPEWRLEQGISEMRAEGKEVVIENIGTYLKWINMDIHEEEGDLIEKSELDSKMLFKIVAEKAKDFYKKEIGMI